MEDVHEVSVETLAGRLRSRIDEAHGGNQRAFAHAMGLTPQHVYALLSGKITVPKPDVRRTLARELGLTHAELLVLTGELEPQEATIQDRPLPTDEAELVRLYRDLPLSSRRALMGVVREMARPASQNGHGSVRMAEARTA